MNTNKLILSVCRDDNEWDNFLEKCHRPNIFSSSSFVNSYKSKKYFILKGNEIIASFHNFYVDEILNNGNLIYSPINFRKINKNQSSKHNEKLNATSMYVDHITKNFKSGHITFDYNTNDLRPFFWKNFDKKKEIFKVNEVRYTLTIDFDNQKEKFIDKYFIKKFSTHNKRHLIASMKEDFKIKLEYDEKTLSNAINSTFERQNSKIDFDINKYFRILKELKKKNKLKMFIVSKNKKTLSVKLFGVLNENAIYMNGGRLSDVDKDTSLTFNFFNSCKMLFLSGVKSIDLEGINSPKRAFWKTGFGGKIRPYYKISLVN